MWFLKLGARLGPIGLAALAGPVWLFFNWWTSGSQITGDGTIYLRMGRRERAIRPFNRRWLMPLILRDNADAWTIASAACTCLMFPVFAYYLGILGMAPWQQFAGAVLLMILPGTGPLLVRFPVLVDAEALLLGLAAAVLELKGFHAWGIAVAAVGCAAKEIAPLLAACCSFSPWPLLGYGAGLVWFATKPLPNPHGSLMYSAGTFLAHRERHWNLLFDAQQMILPWGAVLPMFCWGLFQAPPERVGWALFGLCMSYGAVPFIWARGRCYTWAGPVVIPVALACGWPLPVVVLAVVLHVFNPWQNND